MYRRIAVGFDGSQGSRRALEVAVNLARSAKAELFLVSIEEGSIALHLAGKCAGCPGATGTAGLTSAINCLGCSSMQTTGRRGS